jgi:hypothetical protein
MLMNFPEFVDAIVSEGIDTEMDRANMRGIFLEA